MKRILFGLLAFGVCAAALAVVVHIAHGRGGIRMANHTVGVFDFEVRKVEDHVRGYFKFQQMTAWGRPLVRVGVPEVRGAAFAEHAAEFGGPGYLNGHLVSVHVRVFDGGTAHPDAINLVCRNRAGEVVYQAHGELAFGDIIVAHREEP
ncbi:hypothetical protein FCG40_00790 [Fimbriimonadia bacterium ATM]|nr:hypothetical protein [Fimbriimonadia bacterium ATM]